MSDILGSSQPAPRRFGQTVRAAATALMVALLTYLTLGLTVEAAFDLILLKIGIPTNVVIVAGAALAVAALYPAYRLYLSAWRFELDEGAAAPISGEPR